MIHRSYYRNMRFRFGRAFGEEFLACFEDPHTLAFEAFSDTGNKSREVHRLRPAQTGLHHLDLIKEFIKRPPVWVECELGTTHCLQPFVDVLPTNTKLQPGSILSALAGFRNASLPHGRSKKWLHPRGLLLPVGVSEELLLLPAHRYTDASVQTQGAKGILLFAYGFCIRP